MLGRTALIYNCDGQLQRWEKKESKFCIEQFRPNNAGANVKRRKVSPRKTAFIS